MWPCCSCVTWLLSPHVQAALVFGRHLFAKTRGYTDTKLCWAPKGLRPPLSMLPQLSSLYEEADLAFEYAEQYAARCEAIVSRAVVSVAIVSTLLRLHGARQTAAAAMRTMTYCGLLLLTLTYCGLL